MLTRRARNLDARLCGQRARVSWALNSDEFYGSMLDRMNGQRSDSDDDF